MYQCVDKNGKAYGYYDYLESAEMCVDLYTYVYGIDLTIEEIDVD